MRDEARRYEGSTFSTEKAVACLYAIMFVAVIGMGVQKQLNRIAPAPAAIAVNQAPDENWLR
jgi:hypothetical protein